MRKIKPGSKARMKKWYQSQAKGALPNGPLMKTLRAHMKKLRKS